MKYAQQIQAKSASPICQDNTVPPQYSENFALEIGGEK